MLVAVALCPQPPLLIPAVAGKIAPELDVCRQACAQVIDIVRAALPDRVVLVGGGSQTRAHSGDAVGSLHRLGINIRLGAGDGPTTLPLSLGVARWLYDEYAPGGPETVAQEIAADASSDDCREVGAGLVSGWERIALLVAADGSAYPLQHPVGDDGRGGAYDDRIAAALEHADADALLALDPADDGPLWASGRPALQVLGGALQASANPQWRGRIHWRGAPYGVGYLVASLDLP